MSFIAKLQRGAGRRSIFVALMLHGERKGSHVEFFELEHLDAALARLEALRPQCTGTASGVTGGTP